jgi:hypothetical protein
MRGSQTPALQNRKALAVVARWSCQGWSRDVLLGSLSTADGTLTVRNFFGALEPEVRYVPQRVIRLGEVEFVAYDLLIPAEAGAVGHGVPIVEDSILLDDDDWPAGSPKDAAWHHQVQGKGGRLFARLVTDLDVLAHFRHPNFTRSLDALAENYLFRAANARLLADRATDFVSDHGWPTLYQGCTAVRTAVRGYLTAYPHDRAVWLARFRRALTAHAAEAELDGQRIDALADVLVTLRDNLFAGPTAADPHADAILADLGEPGNLPWLFDYPSYPDYYVPGVTLSEEDGPVPATGKGAFAAFYRQYRRHSDSLHRFLRTTPLHPFTVCWLASKYKGHAAVNQNAAADEMVRIGVFEQEERVPGESFEGRKQNRALVEAVFERPAKVPAALDDDNYRRFRQLVERSVIAALEPDGAFKAEALQAWLAALFSWLYLCGSTEALALLQESDQLAKAYRKLYRRILLLKADANQPLTVDDFRNALLAECADQRQERLVERIFKKVDPAAADLRAAVKAAFITALAETSLTRFDKGYCAVGAQIQAQGDLARQLYEAWLLEVVGARNEEPGCPNLIEAQPGGKAEQMQQTVAKGYGEDGNGELFAEQQRALRGLIFGEYLYATPPSKCSLGENDLSQDLSIIKDMVVHLGDHPRKHAALYERGELKPGTPEFKRLSRINLSSSYPIPDDQPREMRVVLGYHYNLCSRLQQARPHLDNISVMKRFVASVANTDLNVVFINDTLESYNQRQKTSANLFVSRFQPQVVYLMRQAFTSEEKAPAELAAFLRRVAAAIPKADVRVPLFVSEVAAGGLAALPVIDRTLIELPRLRAGKRGLDEGGDGVVVTRGIQERPYLLLAASLLVPEADFGLIADSTQQMRGDKDRSRVFWDIPDEILDEWTAVLNGTLRNNAPVAQLLHEAWSEFASAGSANKLYEALVFTSLLSLAIQRGRATGRSLDLKTHFGALLKDAQRDPAAIKLLCAALGPKARKALHYTLGREVLVNVAESWTPIPENEELSPSVPVRIERQPRRLAQSGATREVPMQPLVLRPACGAVFEEALSDQPACGAAFEEALSDRPE